MIEERDGGSPSAPSSNELPAIASTSCRRGAGRRSSNDVQAPSAYGEKRHQSGRTVRRPAAAPGSGSIIVIVATDAPLLPHQCERLAQRAGLGWPRRLDPVIQRRALPVFATGNQLTTHGGSEPAVAVTMLDDDYIDPLFMATIESTEEAVINASPPRR